MWSDIVAVQFLICLAHFTQAQSPPGVFPQVNNNLAIQFIGQQISPGSSLPINEVQTQPTIGITGLNNGNRIQKYIMLMVDLDANSPGNTRKKRADAKPAAPAQSAVPAAPAASAVPAVPAAPAAPASPAVPAIPAASNAAQQPDDPEHSGGMNTFLHCLIQDYTIGGNGNVGNGATQLQSSNSGPVPYQAPNPQGQHRYMTLLFEQPDNFVIPTSLQGMVQNRQNFDLKQFVQQANLPLPRWGNYFIVQNGNGNNNGNGNGNGASTTTYVTATTATYTVSGFNGGLSLSTSVSQYLTTQTFNNGFNQGGFSTSVSTFTTTTTFPNGGPTQTFQTVSTSVLNDGGFNNNGNGLTAYTTTTTFPNGGPTETYVTVSTLFNNGGFDGPYTSTYLTTTTYPNGGPTQTFLTTLTGLGYQVPGVSGFTSYPSGLLFSTGFSGLKTTTSTGPTTFSTTTTDGNGNVRSFQTNSQTTATLTISGVSSTTQTTYSTQYTSTSTGTSFINGQLFTFTNTLSSSGLTTATFPAYATAGAGNANLRSENLLEKAVLGVAAAALYYI